MFTGIIESLAEVMSIQDMGGDQRFRLKVDGSILSSVKTGDSIAINGVCLTVISFDQNSIDVDVSNETLSCTALNDYKTGDQLNLERAMTLSDRLDGHLVTGHVDSTATVSMIKPDGRSRVLEFECDADIMRYIVHKGSVCVDGTSLTVNAVKDNKFSINVIPHTLEETIISDYQAGTKVNIEVDIVARYIEKMMSVEK